MESQVRFNRVPEKVPEKVPQKVWEALVQSQVRVQLGSKKAPEKVSGSLVESQVRFNRVPEKVPEKVPQKVWEALVQSQVKFNRVRKKVPEKVSGSWWKAKSGSIGFRRRFGEGSRKRGCKAKSGLVRRRPGRLWCRATVLEKVPDVKEALVQSPVRFNMVPEKVWCRARLVQQGSKKAPEKVSGSLVESQVRFNRVPEKVRSGGFRAEPGQVQQRSGEGSEKVPEALVQSQVRFNGVRRRLQSRSLVQGGQDKVSQRSASQHASERCVIIKQCGCWGYHRSLFFLVFGPPVFCRCTLTGSYSDTTNGNQTCSLCPFGATLDSRHFLPQIFQ